MCAWLIFLLIFSNRAFAHGVEGKIYYFTGGIVINAAYDTGEPMSYAAVKIYAPDSKIKFQLGRTDRNGRFAFVPDIPGKWKVIISDRLGHRLNLSINISQAPSLEVTKKIENSPKPITQILNSRKTTAFIGVLLIFGVFGWIKEIQKQLSKYIINLRKRQNHET